MRVFLQYRKGPFALIREFVKIGGAVLSSPLMSLIFLPAPNCRLDGLRLFAARRASWVRCSAGNDHEYATTHGR